LIPSLILYMAEFFG